MRVLTVNAGSSSLKLRVLDANDTVVAACDPPAAELEQGLRQVVDQGGPVDAVGHRVVHGGPRHVAPTLVDDAVLEDLRGLIPLAPLHQPAAIAGIEAARTLLPDLPSVACFDTAFHAELPPAAATYALPRAWRDRFGLRRYGFHGLSYAWASRRAAAMLGSDDLRLVVAHLGAGASLAAIRGQRSVDTTMGFTPMEGVVMATRAGSVDPGLLLHLLEHGGLPVTEVADGLDRQGGLKALAGTADMRQVLERAGRGDAEAELAVEVYQHAVVKAVAAMAASLGGLDALVFTGGVGERSAPVRAAVVDRLGFLGLALDRAANQSVDGDADISAPDVRAWTVVVAAREDAEIARSVRALLG